MQADFVVLPCDITPPSEVPLSDLLDKHRNQAESLLTSLWYEKGDLEIKDPENQEAALVGYDELENRLLMIQPLEAMEDDLSLRMSLLTQ